MSAEAASYRVSEHASTVNSAFFTALFGAGSRRSIALRLIKAPKGSPEAVVGVDAPFVQSAQADNKALVSASAIPNCVFVCTAHGQGKAKPVAPVAAVTGELGGAAGGGP